MKTLLLTTFVFFLSFIFGQDNILKSQLVTYGKVWGFLKYFHPTPSKMDWDDVLLSDFEKIYSSQKHLTNTEFNLLISDLISKCGDYKPKQRSFLDSTTLQSSFEWMNNEFISITNRKYLLGLKLNKPKFKNRYIRSSSQINHPIIKNETNFETFSESKAIHFLALTRYWNIINYYFPYREIIPNNWNEVYLDKTDLFLNIQSFEEYFWAVSQLSSEIRDAHGFVISENDPWYKQNIAPLTFSGFNDKVYISNIYSTDSTFTKLKPFDQVVAIDGVEISEKMKELSHLVAYSNEYFLSKYTYFLNRTKLNSMVVSVERNGQIISDTIQTFKQKIPSNQPKAKASQKAKPPISNLKTPNNVDFTYINMGRLLKRDINQSFKKQLKKTNHLIIDLRNYPNSTLFKLGNQLISERKDFAKFTEISFDLPGTYIWTSDKKVGKKSANFNGKIYLLVDYQTMSHGEYTAMVIQNHPKCTTIGGQTAGADGNISIIPLPFGLDAYFSGLGVFYPNSNPTQQIGVKRDVEVVQDIRYLSEEKDIIMEKAIQLIEKNSQ